MIYVYTVLDMMIFTTVLGDTPSGVWYLTQLQALYGQPMQRPNKGDFSPYEKALIETVQRNDYELIGEGNVGMPWCRCVTYLV